MKGNKITVEDFKKQVKAELMAEMKPELEQLMQEQFRAGQTLCEIQWATKWQKLKKYLEQFTGSAVVADILRKMKELEDEKNE